MKRTLKDIGENQLIASIEQQFRPLKHQHVLGIGDDCSVTDVQEHYQLVTTDTLVEEVHFLRDKISPRALGCKALQINLSDIAAMGGKPTQFWLNLALPQNIPFNWVEEFITGIKLIADQEGVDLLGGDTVRSPGPIMITITVQGHVAHPQIKYRSGAKPGDLIAVTSCLGDALAGLNCLQQDLPIDSKVQQQLIDKQLEPVAQVAQGQWLGSQPSVHAMMDVSDGLLMDLERLCAASQCGAVIKVEDLPSSQALQAYCQQTGDALQDMTICGGEEYCLLFTYSADDKEHLLELYQHRFAEPFYVIGYISNEEQLEYRWSGVSYSPAEAKFKHF